jgi:RNA 2',3'-cyclic 3'-phosphodiesterase
MRLFVAVDLSAEVAEVVSNVARPALRSVRWTTPEQWHVTLRFLGEVGQDELAGPHGLFAALDTVPASLADHGEGLVEAVLGPVVGWLPGRQVLQVPVEGLDAVASAVRQATVGWGNPPDRSFRAHLTLARIRGRARGPASLAGAPIAARWAVPDFILYSSVAGPEGSRYQVVHRVALPSRGGT